MNTRSGIGRQGPGAGTVEITTTLYDLMESMGEHVSSRLDALMQGAVSRRHEPAQDRMIARKVSRMFFSGRIRFKHPGHILKACPEWFE